MGPDPVVLHARRVVGLYGDPDVTWSVVVALRLRVPLTPEVVASAARRLVDQHPHLGRCPRVQVCPPDAEQLALADLANQRYGDEDPLLRIVLSADGRSLLLAAHHGAVDGLGLLGVASALVGAPLTSNARGIARESEPTGFVLGSLRRLAEAAFAPPTRVPGDRDDRSTETGDWLEHRDVVVTRPGSPALVRTAVDLVRRASVERRGRLVVAMGLSRRPGSPVPTPDRDTAYMRLRAQAVATTDDARRLVAETPPEPAFPVRDAGGLGPRVARLLSGRLGSTVLVSNLGLVDSAAIESIRFWPVPTGPSGLCLGLASTRTTTTITLRARRRWFSEERARWLADLAADCLQRAGQ
jgi:hypothetical protein